MVVTLEMVLTLGVLFFSVVAINAASQAHIARVSARVNCQANNDFRTSNITLWLGPKGILAIVAPPSNQSLEAKQFRQNITDQVLSIYKTRACPVTSGTANPPGPRTDAPTTK